MKANEFTRLVKVMEKSERLTVDRCGDDVYVCDGYVIAKITNYAYEAFCRPLSVCMADLADGERAVRDISFDAIPKKEKYNTSACLEKMWQAIYSAIDFSAVPADRTPFTMDMKDSKIKKKWKLRIYQKDETYICIDEKFDSIIADANRFYACSSSKTPVFAEFDWSGDSREYGMFVMPVLADDVALTRFIGCKVFDGKRVECNE